MGEGFVHRHVLRVAAVGIPAGGLEVGAEVLPAGAAIGADPAGMEDPGDPHPISQLEALTPEPMAATVPTI
jgi:hypothetical protein